MVNPSDLFSGISRRPRGVSIDDLSSAAERAHVEAGSKKYGNVWPRTPGGDDSGDPYDSSMKPKNVPVWDHTPATPAEEDLYYGTHMHTESNPFGLHTHVPGGTLEGGHTHSPSNRFGVHHHQSSADNPEQYAETLDGRHTHEGANHPDGRHCHLPENFG